MTDPKANTGRRPDHGLYLGEGVLVLGAVVFLIGFAIEKSSNTPGRVLEATGIVIFAVGLFVAAAFGHLLSKHFVRTSRDSVALLSNGLFDETPPRFGYSGGQLHPTVSDPVAPLAQEADISPENDIAASRLIERERRGIEGGE